MTATTAGPPRRWFARLISLARQATLPALVAALTLSACGGDAEEESAIPSIAVRSPADTPFSLTPPPPNTPFRLVFQESGPTEDKIWRLSPSDPANREQLAAIPHRADWSVKSSLSPDSRLIAYIAVPEGRTDASYQGDLFILDLKRQETELVYQGVDQRYRPLWAPDGQLLYVRRLFGQETFILQIKVTRKPAPGEPPPRPTPTDSPTETPTDTPTETPTPEGEPPPVEETPPPEPTPTPTATPEDAVKVIIQAHMGSVLTFIPVGFAADGRSMYLIQVQGGTGGGTLVAAYSPATTEAIAAEKAKATPEPPPPPPEEPQPTPTPTPSRATFVVKLSEQIARDYDLSPDRNRLSYVAQEIVEGQFVLRAYTADLVAKTTAAMPADGLPPTDHFRPLWHPDGSRLAVGLLPTSIETGAVALVPVAGGPPGFLPAPDRGFDVPAAWAPDGSFLAVTSYSGDSLANPGSPRLDLVAPTGQRIIIADGAQFELVGWFAPPA